MATVQEVTKDYPVHYATTKIGNLDVFYRDAGPKDAPVLLLLHGFPTSSNMFRNLIPRLAGTFRLIAPDYPGFGLTTARIKTFECRGPAAHTCLTSGRMHTI